MLTRKYPVEANNISELNEKYISKHFRINGSLIPSDVPIPITYLLKRTLDFNQHTRINTGAFTRVCYDIWFKDLLNWDEKYLQKYLEADGQNDDPLEYIY